MSDILSTLARRRALVAATLAIATTIAGCIAPLDQAAEVDETPPATGGSMTAKETKSEKSELCTQSLLGGDGRFCAERVIRVDGTLTGFIAMDVTLETFNGDIDVAEGAAGKWGLVVTLRARGESAEAAMAAINEIELAIAHESPAGHFVEVIAEHDGRSDQRSVDLELKMPPTLAMTLVATTSNGDVTLEGGRTDGLALTTSNGDVSARGKATQVSLTTSNGEIDAKLTPVDDGRWSLITSNGDVTLAVPESSEIGYRMEGTTSNGEVDYTLKDGDKGPCPEGSQYYTPPCNHRTFETRRYDARGIQVSAMLTTSNGEINVGPS